MKRHYCDQSQFYWNWHLQSNVISQRRFCELWNQNRLQCDSDKLAICKSPMKKVSVKLRFNKNKKRKERNKWKLSAKKSCYLLKWYWTMNSWDADRTFDSKVIIHWRFKSSVSVGMCMCTMYLNMCVCRAAVHEYNGIQFTIFMWPTENEEHQDYMYATNIDVSIWWLMMIRAFYGAPLKYARK